MLGMGKKHLVAVMGSDLHLSSKPPIFRSKEPDWLDVQKRYLNQLGKLIQAKEPIWNMMGGESNPSSVPLILAGDLFNKHDADPSTITLALDYLPKSETHATTHSITYAIPGNHDLPNHRLDEIKKSAYGSLVAAGAITDILPNVPLNISGNIRLHGFPCGVEVTPLKNPHDLLLEVAVVHAYIWSSDKDSYPDAPSEFRLGKWKKRLEGYSAVLFGDNHMPVEWNLNKKLEGPSLFNPGTFLIRKSSERDHRPRVGLLYSDGTIEAHYLDTSKDRYLDECLTGGLFPNPNAFGKDGEHNFDEFEEELLKLGDESLDFGALLRRVASRETTSEGARAIILNALEEKG